MIRLPGHQAAAVADVAIEYGVPESQLEDALRVATRYATRPVGALPTTFIDRSLERVRVPHLLRAAASSW